MLQYYRMLDKKTTMGWGKIQVDGSEIWDAEPIFKNEKVVFKDWLKLLFYPKKWFLYNFIVKHVKSVIPAQAGIFSRGKIPVFTGMTEAESSIIRVLDIGCGTGSDVISLKKIFGRSVEVYGVDVVNLQMDLAREKIKKYGVWAEVKWYNGQELPFVEDYFDAIYTSDVLGHVADVRSWLSELNRVLKPGGVLAMFSESKLGRHAYVRNYLMSRGLNVDPHAEFHISLYSKNILREYIEASGFEIKKMYSAFWASFLVHPDEFFDKLQNQQKFPILKLINKILYKIKKRLHPYSTALCELYGLVEMYLLGKWVEAQGYVILAKKRYGKE
ncbi:MAG: Methyltransferase type 12 [Candidatus Magasanikbacteria bacterium GW2011_GWC2_37_14]|uniref:Methyltransferase type 12 n=1 Tax=Candidatus Magasanikbacteria bacterium GW2011_GWC2_37_14 TaxID=1619046 RepID=A0A0G0G9G5_9BACT|nr:MAG: Methyltransferase type 12 [Candidatus Magasanikbacteria bacterium GW2011_GWC2_37_14]